MKKGRLNRRVAILVAAKTDDGFSSDAGQPAEVAQRWMSRNDTSDGERITAAAVGVKISSRFACRYDAITAAIRPDTYSLLCDGITFNVTGVKEIGRREGIEITTLSDLVQS